MHHPFSAALPALVAAYLLAIIACGDGTLEVDSVPAPPYTSAVQFDTSDKDAPLLYVEIADTPEERARGLMNRESLPEDAGMLFVWPEDTASGFWMKDTVIPLSIAFIDAGGKIVGIQDMQPLDETLHHSPSPYRYAVEANQGWFAERGIAAGDSVTLPESLAGD